MSAVLRVGVLAGIAALSACGNAKSSAADTVPAASSAAAATPAEMAGTTDAPAPAPSSGDRVIAACPSLVGGRIQAGARRLGDMSSTTLPLTDAAIATIAAADYDPAAGNLQESEADEVEGPATVTGASFSYAPSLAAVSLVCRYGKSRAPLSGEAMLLIPLTPRWAKCHFVAPGAGHAASMTCQPMEPIE